MARKYTRKHPTYRKTSNAALKHAENLINALQGNQRYFPALFKVLSNKKISDFRVKDGLSRDEQIAIKEESMKKIIDNISAKDLEELLYDDYGNRRPDNYLSTVDTIMTRYRIYEPKKIKAMMNNIITAREVGDDFYTRFKTTIAQAVLDNKNVVRSAGTILRNKQKVQI